MRDYKALYKQSVDDIEAFWLDAAQHISWDTLPEIGLDRSNAPFYKWFPDGRLNTCFNAVDRHVLDGRGDQNAIIYDSPITGVKRNISFAELQQQTAKFAGMLERLGVQAGDRVIIYMPMILGYDVMGMLSFPLESEAALIIYDLGRIFR